MNSSAQSQCSLAPEFLFGFFLSHLFVVLLIFDLISFPDFVQLLICSLSAAGTITFEFLGNSCILIPGGLLLDVCCFTLVVSCFPDFAVISVPV